MANLQFLGIFRLSTILQTIENATFLARCLHDCWNTILVEAYQFSLPLFFTSLIRIAVKFVKRVFVAIVCFNFVATCSVFGMWQPQVTSGESPKAISGSPPGLRFRFSDASWDEVMGWLSKEAGLAVASDDLSNAGKVTFVDNTKVYTVDEALDVLGDLLLSVGYGMVRSEKVLHILRLEDSSKKGMVISLARRVEAADLPRLPRSAIVKCRIRLEDLQSSVDNDSDNLRQLLEGMLSPVGTLVLFPGARQAEVIDTVRQLRAIVDSISPLPSVEAELIPLRYQPSHLVLERLKPVLNSMESKNLDRGDARAAIEVAEGFDRRSIVVAGSQAARNTLTAIIQEMDRPGESESFESYSLAGLDLRLVQDKLNALLPPRASGEIARYDAEGRAPLATDSEFAWFVDLAGGELVVKGSPWHRQQVQQLIEVLRSSNRAALSERVRIIPLSGTDMQDALLRTAELWKLAGRKTPIVLQSDVVSLLENSSLPSNSLRISMSDDQTTFWSVDSAALDEFVRAVEQTLASRDERFHEQVEINVRHQAASILVEKIEEVLFELRGATPTIPPAILPTDATPPAMLPKPSFTTEANRMQTQAIFAPNQVLSPKTPSDEALGGFSAADSVVASKEAKPIVSGITAKRLSRQSRAFRMTPIDHQKMILVSASSVDLALIKQLVGIFDNPLSTHERMPRSFRIAHRTVADVHNHLKQIYGERLVDTLWMSSHPDSSDVPSRIHALADPKTNLLFVNAVQEDLDNIAMAIATVDRAEVVVKDETVTAILPITGQIHSKDLSTAIVSLYGHTKSKTDEQIRSEPKKDEAVQRKPKEAEAISPKLEARIGRENAASRRRQSLEANVSTQDQRPLNSQPAIPTNALQGPPEGDQVGQPRP